MSVKIFYVFVCFAQLCASCLGSMQDTQEAAPGYVYYPELNGYLKLHTQPATWMDATACCSNEGAYLAAPWSPAITSAVRNLQPALPVLFSGTTVNYFEGVVERNGNIKKRCGVFFANGTTGDTNCWLPLPYVCFAAGTPSVVTTPTTPVATPVLPKCGGIAGYEYSNETGRCYKFHKEFKVWIQANGICMNEGGSLAVINSDVEAKVLVSHFQRHPAESVITSIDHVKEYVFLGFYYVSSDWETVEGQTPQQAGYVKWKYTAGPEKKNVYTYPFGTMDRNGLLWHACNVEYMFICEKLP